MTHVDAPGRRVDLDAAASAALSTLAGGPPPKSAVPALTRLVGDLRRAGRLEHGRALADALVAVVPDEPAAWLARSEVAHRQGDLGLAVADTRAAMARARNGGAGAPRLVQLLYEAGDLDAAMEEAEAALAADAGNLDMLALLADVQDAAGRTEAAAATVARALIAREARGFGSAQLLMACFRAGRLDAAARDLHLRWALSGAPPRPFPQPAWDGTPRPGERLLVWGEQGLGEEIWSTAMLAEAAARVGGIVLECSPRLVALFARSFPGATVVARGDPPAAACAAASVQAAAVGLLAALPASPTTHTPHVVADPAVSAGLRARYRALGDGPIVGVSWRSANRRVPRAKTLELTDWRPILDRWAVFVDLQYGDTEEDRRAAAAALGITIHRDPAVDPLGDLDLPAAQVAAMDAVVSVSNTAAHLAGGLGVPSIVLLPRGRGQVWAWLDGVRPWYSAMRLCRQPRAGEWAPAVAEAAAALDRLLAGGQPIAPTR
ncbi:MAG: hypothetical protein IT561_05625 [Alphaproteobacteria bacterium]|nr:hypothetical protein [Alphaproteobacteria bacterium]